MSLQGIYMCDFAGKMFSDSAKSAHGNMKRILYMFVVTALAAMLPVSCSVIGSNDVIYDIAPIVPMIYLSDEDGNNLLDPDNVTSGFDVTLITAEFEGKTYSVVESGEHAEVQPETRAYFPIFSGLRLCTDSYGKWLLSFGELDGQEDMDNEDLVISWGDGTSSTITIFNRFRWKANGAPSITRRFYVDGKRQDSDIATFRFVK